MSWDKSDNGDTSRMCYYWILEEVENHLKKVIYSKEDRWFNILDYDVRSRKRDVDKRCRKKCRKRCRKKNM